MATEAEILDSRDERQSALERFARPDEGRAMKEVTIPAQAFSVGNERVIGAQSVAVYRDETRVLQKLKALAAAAGTDWFYRYPVQNKRENRTDWIEGPSIKLANDLARVYGNCDVDVRVLDLGDSWLFYARFTDYETGFSLTRPFQQRKDASKLGGKDDGRRLDIALQIGASKAIRNVVVNALQTFSDFAFDEARGALVDKIGERLEHYRQRVTERFAQMTIDPKRVELIRGRKVADWLAPDIARTIAEIQAVQDGMASADETWPKLDAEAGAAGADDEERREPEKGGDAAAAPASKLDEFAAGKGADADADAEPEPQQKAGEEAKPEEAARLELDENDDVQVTGFGPTTAREGEPKHEHDAETGELTPYGLAGEIAEKLGMAKSATAAEATWTEYFEEPVKALPDKQDRADLRAIKAAHLGRLRDTMTAEAFEGEVRTRMDLLKKRHAAQPEPEEAQ